MGASLGCFYDESIEKWRFVDLNTLQQQGDPRSVRSTDVAISPDGRYVALGHTDFHVSDIPNGTSRSITSGHRRSVEEFRLSNDGTLLATMSADTITRVWDVAQGILVRSFRGHKMGNFGGGFSSDRKTFCTVNNDRTLKLWHIDTGRELASFNLSFTATQAGFSPDGRFLVAWARTLCRSGALQVCRKQSTAMSYQSSRASLQVCF